MPSEKYLKYQVPQPPADVNQEFMTVQETAWVLGCGVKTVRRRIADLGIKGGPGARIITSRADRLAIHEASRPTPARRTGRPRKLRAA
ncbi:DNA-binding protein [Streptomyces sp. NPDC088925]|uniref:DNA-binding protein n=1 Tax=Streptomyces sp. NPDC088925 TaxID=3365914 RepID=UPI0037FF5539